jgi:hypothetical protein
MSYFTRVTKCIKWTKLNFNNILNGTMYSYILSQHFINSIDNKTLEQNSIQKSRHSSVPCTSTIIDLLCSPLAHASAARHLEQGAISCQQICPQNHLVS